MKQLLDFIPLIIFFIFFKFYDIYVGVAALMIASTIAVLLIHFWLKKIDKMTFISYILVMFFGTLTIIFRNDAFIKWKVTIIYIIFASILLFSQFFLNEPLIKKMLGKEFILPDFAWKIINIAWILFFIFCAILNTYVAFNFSQSTWMNFKTFIFPAMMFVFTIFTGAYIYKNHQKS